MRSGSAWLWAPNRADMVRLVLMQGLKLTAAGVAAGIAGALTLTRFIVSELYGVTPTDSSTFAVVSLLLSAVALLASYVPARRAMQVDPVKVLRGQ
jgi:putative ABC transport system permease protein